MLHKKIYCSNKKIITLTIMKLTILKLTSKKPNLQTINYMEFGI